MQATLDINDLTSQAPVVLTLTAQDLADLPDELRSYHAHFAPLFQRREQREWAVLYLRGLLLADVPRKNVEAMALRLRGAGPAAARTVRALQQFVSEGAWDDTAILAAHQTFVEQTLGEDDGVLIIDGSDVPKQGTHSVGVARQWCGASGKTDNCQAGVYLGYASRQGYTLLDRRLYLHASWFAADHQDLWRACVIPDGVRFETKLELAADLVEEVQQHRRVRARWLACDAGYGQDPALLDRVAATGLWYLAEVPALTPVWPGQDPATGMACPPPQLWVPPTPVGRRGRAFTKACLRPDSPRPVRVDTLHAQFPDSAWHRYRIFEGSKGPLVADFAALRAVTTRHGLPGPEVWVLVRRAVGEPGVEREVKIYLSNAPADMPLAELVRVSGMRWPIESCFEEGKSELGLDHYELRSWRGWHHHMTLVLLAHHFLVRLQQRLNQRGGAKGAAGPPASAALSGRPRGRASPSARRRGAERGPSPAAAAGRPAAAASGHRSDPGARVLPAAAEGRGVFLPPQAHLAPTQPPSPTMKSRCKINSLRSLHLWVIVRASRTGHLAIWRCPPCVRS
jgi:SRSO17 transposase